MDCNQSDRMLQEGEGIPGLWWGWRGIGTVRRGRGWERQGWGEKWQGEGEKQGLDVGRAGVGWGGKGQGWGEKQGLDVGGPGVGRGRDRERNKGWMWERLGREY